MTFDKVREVVEKYKRIPVLLHEPAKQINDYSRCTSDKPKILKHINYMLYKLSDLLDESRLEKSFRWLGFIQGCLFCLGLCSLNDLKNDSRNRPDQNQMWFKFD